MSAGRFPKGCDLLADIRRQGYRPELPAFVFLDSDRPLPKIYADQPLLIEISVRPRDAIENLDFWPIADLDVHVHGGLAINNRLRALLRALQGAKPRFLMVGVPREGFIASWSAARGWESTYAAE